MAAIDCPFSVADRILLEAAAPCIAVDFHAESTEEKEALGFYLDGRVSVIVGTHTHVQTADEKILPGGTAYITDLGMTGPVDSVIGMDKEICLSRVKKQVLYKLGCAEGKCAIQGVFVTIDDITGRALSIARINRMV
jgi:metallophosphoesterase (TIGR00282 family)